MRKIDIRTPDGVCPASVHTPQGEGPWPGVLMFMDGPGIRPAIQALAGELAAAGFYVLLPDMFYRSGPYPPIDIARFFSDPAERERFRTTYMAPLTAERAMSDAAAFLAFLADAPEVKEGPVGVVGYCMGGRLALMAAGTHPDRIAAAASFHGGGLASADDPASPHRLAPKMKARIYVGGAIEDAHFDEAEKARLEAALTEAGVVHCIETYPAKHGWVFPDMPVYDAAESEHHRRELVRFFDEVLKG